MLLTIFIVKIEFKRKVDFRSVELQELIARKVIQPHVPKSATFSQLHPKPMIVDVRTNVTKLIWI